MNFKCKKIFENIMENMHGKSEFHSLNSVIIAEGQRLSTTTIRKIVELELEPGSYLLLDELVRPGVHVGRGLVENKHSVSSEHCTGKTEELALSHRQVGTWKLIESLSMVEFLTSFAHFSRKSLFQLFHRLCKSHFFQDSPKGGVIML